MIGQYKKDKIWKLTEKRKNEIIKELKHNEIDGEYKPKEIIKITFPNLTDEEHYKIMMLSSIFQEYFTPEDEDYEEGEEGLEED